MTGAIGIGTGIAMGIGIGMGNCLLVILCSVSDTNCVSGESGKKRNQESWVRRYFLQRGARKGQIHIDIVCIVVGCREDPPA